MYFFKRVQHIPCRVLTIVLDHLIIEEVTIDTAAVVEATETDVTDVMMTTVDPAIVAEETIAMITAVDVAVPAATTIDRIVTSATVVVVVADKRFPMKTLK